MKKTISVFALALTCLAAKAQQPNFVKDSSFTKGKGHDSTYVKKDHDSTDVKKDHDANEIKKNHDTTEVAGCRDRFSINYNPSAKKPDSSCVRVHLTFNVHKLKHRHVNDTLSAKPLIDCGFDYHTAVDSAKITHSGFTAKDSDSTSVTWEIYQGKKTSRKSVKYAVRTPGDKLFILTVKCPTSNKMESEPQAITLADVGNSSVATGTKHDELENDLSVYPNPATHEINIGGHLNDVHKIAVYTIFGHEVYSSAGADRKIDVSALPAGHYFVKIHHGSNVKVIRFVK